MITKKIFDPRKVVWYVRYELVISIPLIVAVWVLFDVFQIRLIALPFSIAATLGGALAIFLGFRNNNSYGRWWEARTLWGNIINNSRIFARQIIANAQNAIYIGKATPEEVEVFTKSIVYRQIAFAHALRLHLRNQREWEEIRPFLLDKAEYEQLIQVNNLPNMILQTQAKSIKEGIRKEILGGFDNISIEPTLAGFNNFQGACERIKNTPLLRQYHYFTNVFLYSFMALLPFCLVGDFAKLGITPVMMPIAILLCFIFSIIAKVGEANEDPFENRPTDVPMTAICNTIERDLREMLDEKELPAKPIFPEGVLM
ncbi:MAG: hydrogenase [Cytophagales bacterium]|nr:MAG: hydrogenase [Cytophagales bacterium]